MRAEVGPDTPNPEFVSARATFLATRLPAKAPPPGLEPHASRAVPAPAAQAPRVRFALDDAPAEAPAVTRESQDAARQQEVPQVVPLAADAAPAERQLARNAGIPFTSPPKFPSLPLAVSSRAITARKPSEQMDSR